MGKRPRGVDGLDVYPVASLAEAVGFLSGQVDMEPESIDLERSSASSLTWKKTSSA